MLTLPRIQRVCAGVTSHALFSVHISTNIGHPLHHQSFISALQLYQELLQIQQWPVNTSKLATICAKHMCCTSILVNMHDCSHPEIATTQEVPRAEKRYLFKHDQCSSLQTYQVFMQTLLDNKQMTTKC